MDTSLDALGRATVMWHRALQELLAPARQVPPGRLSLADLSRLVDEREDKLEDLLWLGEALVAEAPMLGRLDIAVRLELLARQAVEAMEFDTMVYENLLLYEEHSGVAAKVGLEVGWRELSAAKLRQLEGKVQQLVVRALSPKLGGTATD